MNFSPPPSAWLAFKSFAVRCSPVFLDSARQVDAVHRAVLIYVAKVRQLVADFRPAGNSTDRLRRN
jgi:hypothetical protein